MVDNGGNQAFVAAGSFKLRLCPEPTLDVSQARGILREGRWHLERMLF